MQCTIQKEIATGFFSRFQPKYHFHISGGLTYMFSAQKKLLSNTTSYVFSTDRHDFSDQKVIGRLISNFFCTEYKLYDAGKEPSKCKNDPTLSRSELGYVHYARIDPGEPRKITVVIPKKISKMKDSLINDFKNQKLENLYIYKNHTPKFNKETGEHFLNFYGRALKPSAKNFQLI